MPISMKPLPWKFLDLNLFNLVIGNMVPKSGEEFDNFDLTDHSQIDVHLLPEPDNPKDPNAILVKLNYESMFLLVI